MVLAVNAWDEARPEVSQFVRDGELKQRVLLDGKTTGQAYGIIAVPTLLWINRAGVVVATEVGFHGPESLEGKTKDLLSSSG